VVTRVIVKIRCLFLATFGLNSAFFFASAQNLITNGDFESPPFAPSFTVTGWTVSGSGQIHSSQEGATTPTHSAALNIGGDSQGSILSQSFSTTVGTLYRLDFDSAIFGTPDGNSPLTLNVQVNGNTTLINDTVLPPAAETYDPSAVTFRHYQYTFRADNTTTTLQFTDIGLGNSVCDTVVDTVSIAATPTPAPVNLVTNGDFETGPFNTVGTVSGWAIGGNRNVGDTAESATNGTHSATLSAGGDSDGNTLSQTLSTAVGKQYTLDFDAGVFGPPASSTLQLNVKVMGNSTLINQTITPPLANTSNPNAVVFDHYHYTFTTDSTVTTLIFTDIGTGNPFTDTLVDNVVVPQISLLINGDFETPPFESTTITGWNVSGNGKVEIKSEGATSPTHSAAFGPGTATPGNILNQSFTTVAGTMYALDFDATVYGIHSGSPLQLRTQIIGSGNILDKTLTPPEAGNYNAAQQTFQHYRFNFIANTPTTTLQFQDLGSGGAGADVVVDTASVVVLPAYTFAQWQMSFFNLSQRGNPSISGWSADPDSDGIDNGLEYFFGTNPVAGIPVAESNSIPHVSITSSGSSSYLTLTYHRLIGWSGNPEVIQVSNDLITWDSTQSQIEQVGSPVLAGDGLTEIVTVRLKTPINQGPIPKKFLRISLTQ
jgi:Protein of unknown function (DUF642)/Carbohydrate binding domain